MVTGTGPAVLDIEPGTPMRKVIPPRLIGPYLNGQRSIIAGFVYRGHDATFRDPAQCFAALDLGYEGSEFTADMGEIYFLGWRARDMDTYVAASGPGGVGQAGRGTGWPGQAPGGRTPATPARTVPEYYTDPMPIPVGAAISRLTVRGDDLIARYDGLVWRRPTREV
jgi:hypothetical protein